MSVWKSRDEVNQCANFVITEYSGAFDIAPDVIWYQRTKSNIFTTDTETVRQNVPHKITLADMQSMTMFFQINEAAKLAFFPKPTV